MSNDKKAKAIVLIEKIRLIDSELFILSAKYGVRTVNELDKKIKTGMLSEKFVGEDLFTFDHLMAEKDSLESELTKLHIKKISLPTLFRNFLQFAKVCFV